MASAGPIAGIVMNGTPHGTPRGTPRGGGGAERRLSSDENAENVKVFVRIRPKSRKEVRTKDPEAVRAVDNRSIGIVKDRDGKQNTTTFDFDGVFGCEATQEEVYNECVRPYVDEVLEGFSCVVFAYGQTGTGKTHTMQGSYGDDRTNRHGYGMIPRVSEEIFERLEATNAEFSMRASCIELYNEELKDLLSVSPGGGANAYNHEKPIKIQDSGDARGEVLMNVEEVPVTNVAQIYSTLLKAMSRRATATTGMNDRSSRSHALFSLKVHIKETDPVTGDQRVKIGQLNLVDLAGSECSSDSNSRGRRAAEAKNINQSLVTLGRVITALVKQDGYIPYRDSKLTRLLKESLGGKARTCIIATVSPCSTQAKESKNTLNYAQNAKEIRNRPVQNCHLSAATQIKNLEAEILQLKRTLKSQYAKNGVVLTKAEFDSNKQQLQALRAQVADQAAALADAREQVAAIKDARRKEEEGARATWEAVVGGGGAGAAAGLTGEAGGPLRMMAEALETAQAQLQGAQAERDEATARAAEAEAQLAATREEAGCHGTALAGAQEQTAVLVAKNARLEARVTDLAAQLAGSKADAAAVAQRLGASQGVFGGFIATLEQAMARAAADFADPDAAAARVTPASTSSGSSSNRNVNATGNCTPTTPRTTALRKLSGSSVSSAHCGDENNAPGSRRVSGQGKEVVAQAVTASPLTYGGRPVEHVPETPVTFSAKNNGGAATTGGTGHNQLNRILSLTAEYKSSRVQELRNEGRVSRPQSSDSVLRERSSGTSPLRASGAFARKAKAQ